MGTHAYSTNSLMGPKEKSYTKEINSHQLLGVL
jgi:hypothetical protein